MRQSGDVPVGNGGSGGGTGGGITVIVTPGVFEPNATTPLYVGVPYKVQGGASAETNQAVMATATLGAFKVTSVTATFDGIAIQTVDDSGAAKDWSSWHAIIEGSLITLGPHTLMAHAAAGTRSGTQTVHVQAGLMLSCVSPVLVGGAITTTHLSQALTIQVADTTQFDMTKPGSAWQCQAGGTTAPVTVNPPATGQKNPWQLTVGLPAIAVTSAAGTLYTVTITATTTVAATNAAASVSLSLPVLEKDDTKPDLSGTLIPDNVPPGDTPTVTVHATDKTLGNVFSDLTSAMVQFDGQQLQVTQTVAGDPATWTAKLPPVGLPPAGQPSHQVLVTVTDGAGNVATLPQQVWTQLKSWTRLEPYPRDPTLLEGVQARIADPGWLLARQAAFGELTGTDNASPVAVRMRAKASALTRLRPAPQTGPGVLLPPGGGPLEALTEAEPEPAAGGPSRPLFAAQAGLHYRRLLNRATGTGDLSTYEQGLSQAYPLLPPPEGSVKSPNQVGMPPMPQRDDPALQPYVLGQVPDGERLYADLDAALRPPRGGQGTLPASPPLGGANPAVVTSVATQWLDWYDAVSGQELGHTDTWLPDRMEYGFSISAPGPGAETVLAAAELDTGRLDWHDFDLLASYEVAAAPGASLGAVPSDLPSPPYGADGVMGIVYAGLPAPVRFHGMPNQSWWEFDDASIDFGAITAPAESLTTSVMVEFAMRYGNDHFLIPVPLSVGSVLRVDSLVVVDTFGEVLLVPPVSEFDGPTGPFRLFEQTVAATAGSGTPARDPLLVLFPTLGQVIEGAPVEEVHFIRDEAAELVWAIEQTALGPNGLPTDRTAAALAHFLPLVPTPNDSTALPVRGYLLRTDVEANWFPFLIQDPATGNLLAMADVPPVDETQPTPLPWGRILVPFAPSTTAAGKRQHGVLMPIEEVTSAGAQVVRSWRYARWTDGRQLSWVGRRVRPGHGPGASGLTFDLAL